MSRAKRLAKLKRLRGPLREWFVDPLERQLLNLLLIGETTYRGIVSVKISYYILLYISAVEFCNLLMLFRQYYLLYEYYIVFPWIKVDKYLLLRG